MRGLSQQGFTLIELVLVIVILGILAAVAVPRFVDLTGQAEKATIQAQAAALTSASAINFATYKAVAVVSTTPTAAQALAINGTAAVICVPDTLNKLLQEDVLVAATGATGNAMTVAAGTGTCPADGAVTCTISRANAAAADAATATIYCTAAAPS